MIIVLYWFLFLSITDMINQSCLFNCWNRDGVEMSIALAKDGCWRRHEGQRGEGQLKQTFQPQTMCLNDSYRFFGCIMWIWFLIWFSFQCDSFTFSPNGNERFYEVKDLSDHATWLDWIAEHVGFICGKAILFYRVEYTRPNFEYHHRVHIIFTMGII